MKQLSNAQLMYLYLSDIRTDVNTTEFPTGDYEEYLFDIASELVRRGLLDVTSEVELTELNEPVIHRRHRLSNSALNLMTDVFIITMNIESYGIEESDYKEELYNKL